MTRRAIKLSYESTNGTTFKVYRVGTDKCPVKIDWTSRIRASNGARIREREFNNLPFKVKELC